MGQVVKKMPLILHKLIASLLKTPYSQAALKNSEHILKEVLP